MTAGPLSYRFTLAKPLVQVVHIAMPESLYRCIAGHIKQIGTIRYTNDRPKDYWAKQGFPQAILHNPPALPPKLGSFRKRAAHPLCTPGESEILHNLAQRPIIGTRMLTLPLL
jgi:hypothetical protein